MVRRIVGCVTVWAVAVAAGCADLGRVRSLRAIDSPAIPAAAQEVVNPLRGQYEDLLEPLFPQANPAQKRYPPWPRSYDASLRVSWRQLQPTDPRTLPPGASDDQRFDFRVIDDTLERLADRGMRLTLRVHAYTSCCDAEYPDNTNIKIPDWLRALPDASTSYPGPPAGSSKSPVTQVVPNWNDPAYLENFARLLAALGRRYDRDERLSVFEFSGYGDFSENHNAYLRDVLGVPGPDPYDSPHALGYVSQFRDQSITKASIEQLVAANVDAFRHTQLVVTPQNPEIVRQLLAQSVTEKLSAPVGIRSDCLGVFAPLPVWAESDKSYYVESKDPLVDDLTHRLATAPVITEWCDPPSGAGDAGYYRKGLGDIVKYHVSMTSSTNFADAASDEAMDPQRYLLWARANVAAGYRYSVEARASSASIKDGVATVTAVWTNYGSAATTENWVPGYRLADFSGAVVRTLPATVALQSLVYDTTAGDAGEEPVPVSASESVRLDVKDLPPGHYSLQASVAWGQHKPDASHVVDYPPMRLARDGRDGTGWYPIATLDIPRDAGGVSTSGTSGLG